MAGLNRRANVRTNRMAALSRRVSRRLIGSKRVQETEKLWFVHFFFCGFVFLAAWVPCSASLHLTNVPRNCDAAGSPGAGAMMRTPQATVPPEEKPTTSKTKSNMIPAADDPPYPFHFISEHMSALFSEDTDDSHSLFGAHARPYSKWERSIPCFPASEALPKTHGLLCTKLMKTGSTTCAGINARIARNTAKRTNVGLESCDSYYQHKPVREVCPNRDKNKSFLWTTVRDPTSRLVSNFFFLMASQTKDMQPSDDGFGKYFKRHCKAPGHYIDWLSVKDSHEVIVDPVKYVNGIMNEYDFIAVTERMDESLVALAMLLSLPLADVLYQDAKQKGSYGRHCTYIVPSFVSPGMESLIKTSEFQTRTHWERVLHRVANRSLDLTIDRTLGRAEFETKLAKFRHAQRIARIRCPNKYNNVCSTVGNVSAAIETGDCFHGDQGCGYHCLNKVADELDLWSLQKRVDA